METYKKPVVASKNEIHDIIPIIFGRPIPPKPLRKLLSSDDFHKEASLTPRKKLSNNF